MRPTQCSICGIFSASYVTYSVLHMLYIQCFICDLFSAPYVTYPVLHMWPTQCFICDLPSASYVAYPVLHMLYIQCFICDLFSASYAAYSVLHMWPTQCFICSIFSALYVIYPDIVLNKVREIISSNRPTTTPSDSIHPDSNSDIWNTSTTLRQTRDLKVHLITSGLEENVRQKMRTFTKGALATSRRCRLLQFKLAQTQAATNARNARKINLLRFYRVGGEGYCMPQKHMLWSLKGKN